MGRGARGPTQSVSAASAQRRSRRAAVRGPYRWTDDVLEAELRAFIGGRSSFPTLGEFDDEDRSDLRCAVARDGVAYWADRVGLPVPASRVPTPYTTTDAIRDAQAVIDAIGRLPGEPTLRKMGLNRLATVVRNAGGSAKFTIAHDLSPHRQP